jgi:ElaB/YqjD/DUF883 family membrane-anchored ribosome-binding protein
MSQEPRYPSSSQGMSGSMDSSGSEIGRSGMGGDGSAMTADERMQSESNFADRLSDKAGDATSKLQEQASNAGSKMQEQADMGIDKAAGGLEKAAEQMRGRFEDQDGVQAQVGTKVADSLEKTAGYLRDHEADQIWQDVEQFVKDHPLQAAAGAAVAGFVIARVLR